MQQIPSGIEKLCSSDSLASSLPAGLTLVSDELSKRIVVCAWFTGCRSYC